MPHHIYPEISWEKDFYTERLGSTYAWYKSNIKKILKKEVNLNLYLTRIFGDAPVIESTCDQWGERINLRKEEREYLKRRVNDYYLQLKEIAPKGNREKLVAFLNAIILNLFCKTKSPDQFLYDFELASSIADIMDDEEKREANKVFASYAKKHIKKLGFDWVKVDVRILEIGKCFSKKAKDMCQFKLKFDISCNCLHCDMNEHCKLRAVMREANTILGEIADRIHPKDEREKKNFFFYAFLCSFIIANRKVAVSRKDFLLKNDKEIAKIVDVSERTLRSYKAKFTKIIR